MYTHIYIYIYMYIAVYNIAQPGNISTPFSAVLSLGYSVTDDCG